MNSSLINRLLSEINQKSQALSSIEKENITRDLRLILNFIESEEYQSTELLNRNRFDTQKRTREFFSYIKGYNQQATAWCELLHSIPITSVSCVLNIGPGYSPKIESALQLAGFKGQLTVLDKSEPALNGLRDFLRFLDVSYALNFICDDLFTLKHRPFNLVTANHLFDDLIIDNYCTLNQISLASLYESEAQVIKITDHIIDNFDSTSLRHQLSCVLHELVDKQGYLLFRHYQGLTETALQLNCWYKFVTQFFENTVSQLLKQQFSLIKQQHGFVLLCKNRDSRS